MECFLSNWSVRTHNISRYTKDLPLGRHFVYRGNQIRTDDILLPKQTLYQAELHPEYRANIANYFNILESSL